MTATITRLGRSTPATVAVEQHAIVGQRMEYQTLVQTALDDAGAAIAYLAFDEAAPTERPAIYEALRVLRLQRSGLSNLLAILKAECGVLDGLCDAECVEPGHGAAA